MPRSPIFDLGRFLEFADGDDGGKSGGIGSDEVFVSDGSKCDISRMLMLFGSSLSLVGLVFAVICLAL